MRIILTLIFACVALGGFAQEKKDIHANDIINTVKERLTITGFLQAGYDYEDGNVDQKLFQLKKGDCLTICLTMNRR